jgi:putative acetyltransferase
VVSLVAIEEDKIIGHILFTKLPIETGSAVIRAAALAPVSVAPLRQRQGIGSTLVRKGIDACFKRGVNVVIVVGHLDYYPRFGFSAEKAKCISSKYSGPHFMALELTPHILDGIVGKVRYPAAFSEVD